LCEQRATPDEIKRESLWMLASDKLSLFISVDAATAASTRNKRSGSESGVDLFSMRQLEIL
jgi:hypothetical protein